MSVTIGALRESAPRESRVSLVPEVTDKLIRDGAGVLIERTAGERAGYPDPLYKGVTWSNDASGVLQAADVVLTVQPLTLDTIAQLRSSAVVVGYMQPYARAAEVRAGSPIVRGYHLTRVDCQEKTPLPVKLRGCCPSVRQLPRLRCRIP